MCVRNTNCSDLEIDIVLSIDDQIDNMENINLKNGKI